MFVIAEGPSTASPGAALAVCLFVALLAGAAFLVRRRFYEFMGSIIKKPMYDLGTSKGRRTYRINFVAVPLVMVAVALVGAFINLGKLISK